MESSYSVQVVPIRFFSSSINAEREEKCSLAALQARFQRGFL